jgi:RNA polymerase sigma-70 factor, ECF subfamily
VAGIERFNGEFDAVLDGAQSGAPWAFERMFTTLAPVVTGYLRVQGAHEPEDLCSEVFVAVLRNVGHFEGDEAAFRSWLFTIAHRRLLDERRRHGRRPPFTTLTEALELVGPDDVEGAVERVQRSEWVRGLCEQLSPDQRDVLLLRLLGRLTLDEVAEVVGKSTVAVKALQRRGFRAIGRILAHEEVSL